MSAGEASCLCGRRHRDEEWITPITVVGVAIPLCGVALDAVRCALPRYRANRGADLGQFGCGAYLRQIVKLIVREEEVSCTGPIP